MTSKTRPQQARNAILMFVGMMLVALNLRPALTSVGPILKTIGDSLALSSIGQGVLTTLPVLLLGLAAPIAPRAARKLGMERAVLVALIILGVALIARPYFGASGLFLGTAVAGGLDPVTAGLALSVSILTQVPMAIAAPWIASHMRDQRFMVVLVMVATLAGLCGSIYAPIDGVWLWVIILGLGQGGSFSIALTLLAVRARDAETAARLSGMAQGLGYTMAALGPLFVGVLHEWFDDWNIAGAFLGVIAIGAIIAGLGAGRKLYVLDQ